jgi:hypothetical protein
LAGKLQTTRKYIDRLAKAIARKAQITLEGDGPRSVDVRLDIAKKAHKAHRAGLSQSGETACRNRQRGAGLKFEHSPVRLYAKFGPREMLGAALNIHDRVRLRCEPDLEWDAAASLDTVARSDEFAVRPQQTSANNLAIRLEKSDNVKRSVSFSVR